MNESRQQNKPAIATVVNFGVSFLQRRETENTENPKAEAKPNNNPIREFFPVASKAMIPIPKAAIAIDIHTFIDILSNGFKCRHNSNAANGSGDEIVYFAWAEEPLVSSGGVPCTAR